jgi:hypothetical protein
LTKKKKKKEKKGQIFASKKNKKSKFSSPEPAPSVGGFLWRGLGFVNYLGCS